MSFCGYAIFTYKERYTNPQKQKKIGTSTREQMPTSSENNDMKESIDFIKEIYKVIPETGNINYYDCDCTNFPEYIPIIPDNGEE
jgi:hypothetical protein